LNRQECIEETQNHIAKVYSLLSLIANHLRIRGEDHDASKLVNPELDAFVEYTPKLSGTTYGSDEYKEMLANLKPALDHHYANNRHHSECHKNGMRDMNLIDITEMLCDWKASSERHADGDIYKSIEINQKRFNYSDDLKQIFINTIKFINTMEAK